jgi:potassium efflux system protein
MMMFEKSIKTTTRLIVGFMMWCLISGVCLPFAWPQTGLPFNQVTVDPAPAEQAVSENPGDNEATIGRLEKELAAARQDFLKNQSLMDTVSPPPIGATQQEANLKVSLQKRKVSILEQHIDAYRTLEEIRHDERFLVATDKGPDKYGKGPPYAISIVDQFREDIYNLNIKVNEKDALRSFFFQGQALARKDLEKSEKNLRQANESLERKRTGSDSQRLKWLRDLAFLENEVARLINLSVKTQVEMTETFIALYQKELSVVGTNYAVVSSQVEFSRDELERKLREMEKERESLEIRYKAALERDKSHQEKLNLARQKVMAGTISDTSGEEMARRRIDVLKAQAETSSQIADMYFYLISGVDVEKILWKERYQLYVDRDNMKLKKAVEKLEGIIARMREFHVYIISSVELSQSLVVSQEKQLNANLINEEEKPQVLKVLDAYRERAEFLSGNIPKLSEVLRNTDQFLDEVRGYRKQLTVGERFFYTIDLVKAFMVSMWNYELFLVDDTIFIDGEKVTGQRAVTVSKIMLALLILIIGFWLSAPLKKKVGALSARFFHVNEAKVVLIEKTFHLFLFISLVIFALVTVKIPLTVFAFMGGALAIGVGFGAQNLINNFISGVILLLEQPIKVGDIIEIDGMSGHVVSVGARCSQVRRFDGIDILVPNSEFLQKNVVNWTLSDSDLRLSIKFGVAYGSSTRDVTDAARQVLEKHGRILKKPAPQVLFEDFGDSALDFTVLFWVTIDPEFGYRLIASDVRHMLSNKFAEENIVIAFPQQDVHLDAGKPIQISLVPDISPPVPKQPESEE